MKKNSQKMKIINYCYDLKNFDLYQADLIYLKLNYHKINW